MTTQPIVSNYALLDCSYNHDGCQAITMNMGAEGCTMFIALPQIGGHSVAGAIGACQKADCTFDENLECQAEAAKVGGKDGECLICHKAAQDDLACLALRRENGAKLYLNLGGLPRADPQDLRYGRAKVAPHEIRKSEDNRRGEHLKLASHEPEAKQRKGD